MKTVKLLLLVLAIALGACACQPAYTGPSGAQRVAVVGDSITNYSTPEIESALGAYSKSVLGIPSIDLADGRTELVQPAVATRPDVLVIELGVNSARETWNSADLVHLEGILADTDSVPCVIWVTPTALAPSYYDRLGTGTLQARIAAFQASLAKRLPKSPNVHVADWGATQVQHPEYFDADHLHPSAAGKKALASYIAAQVGSTC